MPRLSGQPVNLPAAPEPVTITELRALPAAGLESIAAIADQIMPLTGGADGLAQLSTYDFIGEDIDPLDSDEVRAHKARGLRTLEDVCEVAIVAVPDIHIQPKAAPRFSPPPPCIPDPCLPGERAAGAFPRAPSVGDLPPVFPESAIYQVQSALIQHCEKLRDRIALLDPPFSAARDDKLGVGRGSRLAQPLRFQVRRFLLSVAARGRSVALAHCRWCARFRPAATWPGNTRKTIFSSACTRRRPTRR